MVQMAQYVCFKSDLYDHCDDICRYGTLDQLRDMGVYAIRESLADEILNDLSYDEDYAPTDDAKDTIISAIYATFEEKKSENENPPCGDTMVEFYDTEDNGQFVASFHMNTLFGYPWNGMVGADLDGLEAYGFAYPLSTQAATDWLEGDDLAKVNAFLKETCKEVFGILPGADDGGYSLSGEAKEAALSRFALPENRKAALNMIRKLNESRDSNDNAL